MSLKAIALIFSLSLPSASFAFFCPTNFNQIDYGYSMDQVATQCGKPDKQETKDAEAEGAQEWTYYIPQTVPMNTNQDGQGTLKTTVSFDKSGKAVNISVNGIGVGATTMCGPSIALGSTMDAIKSACGQPGFVSKPASTSTTPEAPNKITTFIYNTNPPAVLTFENGQLTGK